MTAALIVASHFQRQFEPSRLLCFSVDGRAARRASRAPRACASTAPHRSSAAMQWPLYYSGRFPCSLEHDVADMCFWVIVSAPFSSDLAPFSKIWYPMFLSWLRFWAEGASCASQPGTQHTIQLAPQQRTLRTPTARTAPRSSVHRTAHLTAVALAAPQQRAPNNNSACRAAARAAQQPLSPHGCSARCASAACVAPQRSSAHCTAAARTAS